MTLKTIFLPIAVLGSIFAAFFLDKPLWDESKIAEKQLAEAKKELSELETDLKNLNTALNQYKKLDANTKELIVNAVPMEKDNDNFIAEIHTNVGDSSTLLMGSKISEQKVKISKECQLAAKAAKSEGAKEAPYCPPEKQINVATLEIIGSYSGARTLIKKLNSQNRLISLKDVSVTNAEQARREEAGEGEGEDGEGEPLPAVGSSVKSSIKFEFYNRKKDDELKISDLSDSDEVFKSLIKKSLDMETISLYKASVEDPNDPFEPVSVDESLKEDLFSR